ncbi:hypothetical protein [Hymenobacter canadensis]|uniref:Lipocalin-like domain-containing protein n=1 Tax=Hymenobacter canadensis TaxID=2999067 RepID=A0ABY7LWT4_9BACT|nr:hypothetical protein [Hymenobacter canadensis]WBA43996.1 hypothetical protein O3303_20745 [Hymenobacter canadensis]
MKYNVLVPLGILLLTSCDKRTPAPPTLVGVWNLESIHYLTDYQDGSPTRERTYVAPSGSEQQEFTADGRVFVQLPGAATGSFHPYRFDGTTVVVSLSAFDLTWTVQELKAQRLVYKEIYEIPGSSGQLTQTFTYSR